MAAVDVIFARVPLIAPSGHNNGNNVAAAH